MPARRSSTRRTGSTPRSGDRGVHKQVQDFSSPDANSPALPEIPTKHSFAYGSSAVPLLPREVAAKPKMNLTEMAQNIDVGIQAAQDRERESSRELDDVNDEPVVATRSKTRPVSASVSPSRRRLKREPTPDQAQLLGTLREASPGVSHPGRSTPTPPPPVPQTLPTISSPGEYRPFRNMQPGRQLYPSPPGRLGSGRPGQPQLGSSPHADSVDNDSTVSWNVERDIYDDDIQRLTPRGHLRTPRGNNISAPPRRFSGLAFPQDPIEEESVGGPGSEVERPPERRTQNKPSPKSATAPTRTIIPNSVRPGSSSQGRIPRFRQSSRTVPQADSEPFFPIQKLPDIRSAAAIALTALSVLAVYYFGGAISDSARGLGEWVPTGKPYPYVPLNTTRMDAVNVLNNQVGKLCAQVSSLSKEVKFVRAEVDKGSSRVEVEPVIRKEVPKVNFLMRGLGAIADPILSSPTFGPPPTWRRTAYEYLDKYVGEDQIRKPQPPTAAMSPWEDVGDCWCSTPREGMSQLSVLLGREIVPEEMELWARFKMSGGDAPPQPGWLKRLLSPSSGESRASSMHHSLLPGQQSLSQYVLETVRMTFENEPESEYSDDELLGPDFYRVGKWEYDPHRGSHIQSHALDTVIDHPGIRVDKVVVRVKSNWGADSTCLYRVKLHGHE
ncbi:hypothetical protein PHISP_04699 [Aspergillus sp. HF37]|nr:hypothetical protein PHISP_04699 [Aspergillus sp. HF37]